MLFTRRAKCLVFTVFLLTLFNTLQIIAAPDPPLISSDKPLEIGDLVNIALENQGLYRKALQDEGFAQYAYRGVYGSFLPRATAYVSYRNTRTKSAGYVYQGFSIPSSQDWAHSTNWDVGLTEDLFTGGSRYFSMKSAELQLENTQLGSRRAKDQVTYSVREAVYRYMAAKRKLDLANEIVELRKESLRFAEARFNSGDVIQLEVMQAEIDLGNAQNSLLSAKQAVENQLENINLTVGAKLESRYEIKTDLTPVLPDLKMDKLISTAIESRPDLLANRNLVKIEDQNIKIAKASYLPTASLNLGFSGSDDGAKQNRFQLLPGSNSRYYGLGISWTMFNQFRTDINRQQSVVNKRKYEWDRHTAEQQVDATIRSEMRNLKLLYDQSEVLDKNRDLAKQQLDLEQERYRLGSSSQLSLRSAQVTYMEAENNHINTVFQYFITLASLERDLGRPLVEVTGE